MRDVDFEAWIGRKDDVAQDDLTPRLVESFKATLGTALHDNGRDLPLGLHWCLCPVIVDGTTVGPDGHPAKGGFLPPIDLPRRMWAGSDLVFEGPLQVGDRISKGSMIKEISFKKGRTGRLAFVKVHHRYAGPRGPVLSEDQTIVYREPGPLTLSTPIDEPSCPPSAGEVVSVDELKMFRYSALTFNGHRIHYDFPYATQVEGYSGLVIHGPMLATFLMNFARKHAGAELKTFSFKGLAPSTGAQTLTMVADVMVGSGDFALFDQAGRKSVEAKATW